MKLGVARQRNGRPMPPGYREYLQSDVWKNKRRAVLNRALHRCESCSAENVPLDVHHKTYTRFTHEELDDLQALCHECHERADFQRKRHVESERYWNRVEGWANKKYGEGWPDYNDLNGVEEEFNEWDERRNGY